MVTWPKPYQPPSEGSSSTAQTSDTTTATTTVTGQTTTTGSGTTVNSNFTTSTTFNDSATMSAVSPAGFSLSNPNAAGCFQTANAQLNEVDLSNGSNAAGLVSASFNNNGSETMTLSFFTTTNTTPAANQPWYQEMQSRSMSTSTSETGSYTTTAPGAPSVTPTLDNPAGYAKLNEERKDNNTVSNSATVSWVATSTGSGPSSETAWMTYNGSADSSYTSDKTVAVDASANTDAQSGSYTATGDKVEGSTTTPTMIRHGTSTGPVYASTWDYQSGLRNERHLNDVGSYPGGGLETLTTTNIGGSTEIDSHTLSAPSFTLKWTNTYTTSTGPGTVVTPNVPDKLAQAAADAGPDAPEEAKDGKAWYNDELGDWLNPFAYVASMYNGTKQGLADGYEFFTKDHYAEYSGFSNKRATNIDKLGHDGDVAAFRKADSAAIKEQFNNVLTDAGKFANGIMAVGDVIGYTKLAASVAGGIINSSLVQCRLLQRACFAAGTPLVTPETSRFVETLVRSVGLSSRPEDDPTAPVGVSTVDAVFVLTAHIWELHIGGRCVETTAEHPFYVVGRERGEASGWTPLNELNPGDLLLGRGPIPTAVERVVRTDRTATVYNVRVEPDHTFFVGGDDWGFSLWVHNACDLHHPIPKVIGGNRKGQLLYSVDRSTKHMPFHKAFAANLKASGFPLSPLGGRGNNVDKFKEVFRRYANSQRQVFNVLIRTAREFDLANGTHYLEFVKHNIVRLNYDKINWLCL